MKTTYLPMLLFAAFAFTNDDPEAGFTYEKEDGVNVLRHEVVVEGRLQDVWNLFTTVEGLRSWITPVAFIDFKEGGIMETSYDPNAKQGDPQNIKAKFLKIQPLKQFQSKNVQVPAGNPYGDVLQQLINTVAMEEVAPGKVKVTIAMAGWDDSDQHAQVRTFFEGGNTWYCKRLIKRMKEGPLPWTGVQ